MAITEQKIHDAADALIERGEKATLTNVRREVGGGSFSTISEGMASWRQSQEQEHALAQVELPEAVNERLQSAGRYLWEAAIAEAENRLQRERDALAEAREEMESRVQEARDYIAEMESEAAQYRQEIEDLAAERDAQKKRADDAEHEHSRAVATAEATEAQIRERLAEEKERAQRLENALSKAARTNSNAADAQEQQ